DTTNPAYSSVDGVLFNKSQTVLLRYPFTELGASYSIPVGVTTIAEYAFAGRYLTNVTIPNGVTCIGTFAFSGCPLSNIAIPASVTNIGEGAFSGEITQMDIVVDGRNPAYSSVGGVLFNKDQSTLLQFPIGKFGSYRIPPTVTDIAAYAFVEAALVRVTVPGSVTNVGANNIGYDSFFEGGAPPSFYFEGNAPSI